MSGGQPMRIIGGGFATAAESPSSRTTATSAPVQQLSQDLRQPSRNARCPCGSGLRFKQCHGRLAAEEGASDKVDFVIAGAQRCGTTVLDEYLRQHPRIAMPWTGKELHFFDRGKYFRAQPVDYRPYHANFAIRKPGQLRGEATPIYMYWLPAFARLASYHPGLKIIVLLRNPITRAYSHWNKERVGGREALSFLDALRAEPERARAASPLQDRTGSYIDRGFYSRQLARLWQHFPRNQTLILQSTALDADPAKTLEQIGSFLGLEPFPPVTARVANAKQYDRPMLPHEWAYVAEIYSREIRDLEQLLGWDCASWLRPPAIQASVPAGQSA